MVDSVQCPLQGALTKTRRQRSQARVRHGRSRGPPNRLAVDVPRLPLCSIRSPQTLPNFTNFNYLMSQPSGTDGAEHQHAHDDLAERLSPENDNIGPTEE
jgi:hypothetical protein